jgi:cell division protein FtsL
MSKGYVAFLTLCVALSAFFAVTYVKVQADVTQRMKTIASLESQITDLRADNDANYKRITTSVDLNEIKDIAMNQLGMTYASEDQIIYYSVENSNYMDQYSDIPEK